MRLASLFVKTESHGTNNASKITALPWVVVCTPMVAGLSVLWACVTTPDSGRKQLNILPESQMVSMGLSAYADIKKKERVSTNAKLKAKVAEIGRRIAKASGRNYKWEFTLFESDQVNAFCLPGGKIGVYTGLLPVAKNNAGLAAIMGHEVAHATARHSNERVSQAILSSGAVLIAGRSLKDNKYYKPIMAALGVGLTVGAILPFSRKHESEADAIGLKFMARAGYDPSEAVGLWHRMAKKGGGSVPEFVSTHPDPKRRARDLKNLQSSVRSEYSKSLKQPTKNLF